MAAGCPRRGRRVQRGPDRDAPRARLLGYRGAPDGRADPRDGPPDGLPDVRAARLARQRAAHTVRGAGAPDEPVRGTERGGRRGRDGRPGPCADALRPARDDGGDRPRAHRHRLGHRHARGGPRAPSRVRGDPHPPARGVGGREARPHSRRGGGRLRAGSRESFADAAARATDRPVRPGRGPGRPAPAAFHRRLRSRARAHGRPRLPGAAAAGRAAPDPRHARVWAPGHLGRVLVRRARGTVPRQRRRSLRRPARQGRGARGPHGGGVRSARCAPAGRVRGDRDPAPDLRPAQRHGRPRSRASSRRPT